jgi:Mlc titration factor MtfA (ptsG expression regulator)
LEDHAPEGFRLVLLLAVTVPVLLLVFYMAVKVYESLYLLLFKKPPFVHFYLFTRRMSPYGKFLLENEFGFYRNLSPKHKRYFRHRVQTFIKHYTFISREGLTITDDIKIKVAATWVTLTFGIRRYKTALFEVVILYPDVYESFNGDLHYAEYNPGVKAIVFSWKHFEMGLDFKAYNVNLGLHQFAHVLHTASINGHLGAAGAMYTDMFNKIMEYLADPVNSRSIGESQFFRNYAYTNEQDFMAVVLEYFFEMPKEFRQELPELYAMVSKMVNYDPAKNTGAISLPQLP